MESAEISPTALPRAEAPKRPNPGRYFHAAAAVMMVVLMLWGFRLFYFHGRAYPGRELTPPIRTLVIVHGTAMAAWMILFLAQPFLILSRNRRLHMLLGKIGAAIAAVIVVLGLRIGIESARVKPPGMLTQGLAPAQFMAIPIFSILMFGAFVAAAVWYRRRPEWHRILILLGTLSALTAAVGRIDVLSNLYSGTVWERIWGPFFMTVVIAFFLLVSKWLLTRSLDRFFAGGCLVLAIVFAVVVRVAVTPAWEATANFLIRLTA